MYFCNAIYSTTKRYTVEYELREKQDFQIIGRPWRDLPSKIN